MKLYAQQNKQFFSQNEQSFIMSSLNLSNPFQVQKISYKKLYGNRILLIVTISFNGGDANYPFKAVILMDSLGKKIYNIIKSDTIYFKKIFKNEKPFLILEELNSKGNGWHRIFGFDGHRLKNFLDLHNDSIKTIDEYYDETTFIPNRLMLKIIKGNDYDTYAISFTGVKETLNKNTNEFVKSKLEISFLYDNKRKLFVYKKQ
jgi:hypothetical protein